MTKPKNTHGSTASGIPITDELVDKLAEHAEAGFDVDATLHKRRGRPPLGSAAATVESVRLDPELRDALAERAQRDHASTSAVIRDALRKYLDVA
jgi:predicted transcriptional regulator